MPCRSQALAACIAAGDGVVIGQRQQLDLALRGQIDQRRRRQQRRRSSCCGCAGRCAGSMTVRRALEAAEQRYPVAGAIAEGDE